MLAIHRYYVLDEVPGQNLRCPSTSPVSHHQPLLSAGEQWPQPTDMAVRCLDALKAMIRRISAIYSRTFRALRAHRNGPEK